MPSLSSQTRCPTFLHWKTIHTVITACFWHLLFPESLCCPWKARKKSEAGRRAAHWLKKSTLFSCFTSLFLKKCEHKHGIYLTQFMECGAPIDSCSHSFTRDFHICLHAQSRKDPNLSSDWRKQQNLNCIKFYAPVESKTIWYSKDDTKLRSDLNKAF